MSKNRLNSHILKEMQLSFQLTEERELVSGRKRPGKPFPLPLASIRKAAPTVPCAPKQIAQTKNQNVESFQKPNEKMKSKQKAAQKRYFSSDTKSETSNPKKKPKKDVAAPVDNAKPKYDKAEAGKGLNNQEKFRGVPKQKADNLQVKKLSLNPGKPKDSRLKIHKKNANKQAFKVPKNDEKRAPAVKANKLNDAKGRKKEVNGSKAQVLAVPTINGFAEKTSSEDSFREHLRFELEENYDDFEMNSDDDLVEEGSSSEEFDGFEDEDEDFFRTPRIFKVGKKNRPKGLTLPAAFGEPTESSVHLSQGDDKGSVRKIPVFEENLNILEEVNNEVTDDDSEESDSKDIDSEDSEYFEYFDSDDSESETTDSEDFGSDIFDSDDLDSTYEPPIIEGFFDDTPSHLKKEPLIIEEIFDMPTVAQNQNELVKYKPKKVEIVAKEVVEESITTKEETEVSEKVEVEAEESQTERPVPENNPVPQLNETPFYRNPQATPIELSVFENSLKSNHVLAVIKENLELYGTLVLTLLSGQVSVNGHKARRQEPLTIYSLKGLPWVSISPTKTKKPARDEVNWQELNENFTRAQLDRIKASFQSHTDAIVLLQRNASAQRLSETFSKHMAQNVFPLLNASNRPYHQSESLLQCLIQNSDLSRTLLVPQVWNKLKIQASSRVMIAGGKGVGKSSLLRYLVNRNLGQFSSFLLIDLDIGQPEIFVPQTVSCTLIDGPLLGPGFLLNKQPDRAYVVGHTNIVMCAKQYAKAVIQLIEHVQKDSKFANIPWLINTMGYNKGFGTELMALLVDRIRPTDLVQISSPIAINNFDSPLEWSTLSQCKPVIYTSDEFRVREIPKYTLHKLQSAVPPKERGTWSLSAKDMRYSNLLARLSSCLTGNAKSFTDCQILGIPLDALKVHHPTSEEYTREELIHGMEANVVYLCHQEAGGLPQCLGIGVVRAIDYERQKLFLVPAMPLQRMSLVNCLILGGELTLPQGYFRDQGQGVSSSVPFVFILDDSKSSKSIQQIYHRAPAFLGVPANQRNGN